MCCRLGKCNEWASTVQVHVQGTRYQHLQTFTRYKVPLLQVQGSMGPTKTSQESSPLSSMGITGIFIRLLVPSASYTVQISPYKFIQYKYPPTNKSSLFRHNPAPPLPPPFSPTSLAGLLLPGENKAEHEKEQEKLNYSGSTHLIQWKSVRDMGFYKTISHQLVDTVHPWLPDKETRSRSRKSRSRSMRRKSRSIKSRSRSGRIKTVTTLCWGPGLY